jgi:hypothetical protein
MHGNGLLWSAAGFIVSEDTGKRFGVVLNVAKARALTIVDQCQEDIEEREIASCLWIHFYDFW